MGEGVSFEPTPEGKAMQDSLFGPADSVDDAALAAGKPQEELPPGPPRLRKAERTQVEMHWSSLDELLEPEHSARYVWQAVEKLDLSRWLKAIQATAHTPGRDATDPRILLALWIYATLEGVSSARALARLCEKHVAYQWLRGGVTLNHHTLSDFRTENAAAWDELLTTSVGTLLSTGLVKLESVAQDGLRVRANAGSSSFRRLSTLEKCLTEAQEQMAALKRHEDESYEQCEERLRAARQRAAHERQERVKAALEEGQKLAAEREERRKKGGTPPTEPRGSTTDPEARMMQFSDGGFRPGYNVQFATDVDSGIIVGVDVVQAGNDSEQLPPMLDQIEERHQKTPSTVLADCGFATLDAVEQVTAKGCTLYAPLRREKEQLAAGKNPYEKKRRDTPAITAWRERMGTEAAKLIYKLRGQTAEWVNALARNRGLRFMPVRGRAKCRVIALLYAITHNLIVGKRLCAEMIPSPT